MSVQAMSWVIDNYPKGGTEFICLLMIANHAHADGTGAFPSLTTLAKECRCSRRQVIRLIKILEAEGSISVERNGTKRSNVYHLQMARDNMSLVTKCHQSSDADVTNASDIAMLPEPSIEPSLNQDSPDGESQPQKTDPLIKALQNGLLRRPSKKMEPVVIELFTGIPIDTIEQTSRAWMLRGYNPTNYQGIADWCRNGITDPKMIQAYMAHGTPDPEASAQPSPAIDWNEIYPIKGTMEEIGL